MRLIIEVRLEGAQTSASATEATIVAVVERQDRSVADLGLTLTEGRALLAEVQSLLVQPQGFTPRRRLRARCLWQHLQPTTCLAIQTLGNIPSQNDSDEACEQDAGQEHQATSLPIRMQSAPLRLAPRADKTTLQTRHVPHTRTRLGSSNLAGRGRLKNHAQSAADQRKLPRRLPHLLPARSARK